MTRNGKLIGIVSTDTQAGRRKLLKTVEDFVLSGDEGDVIALKLEPR